MKKQVSDNYTSDAIGDLLNGLGPEEQYRINCRMLMAVKIQTGLKNKGWKNLDLAHALHLKSPSLVTRWLSGTHNFTIDTLTDIQRVLGIRLLDAASAHATWNESYLVEPVSLAAALQEPMHPVIGETDHP